MSWWRGPRPTARRRPWVWMGTGAGSFVPVKRPPPEAREADGLRVSVKAAVEKAASAAGGAPQMSAGAWRGGVISAGMDHSLRLKSDGTVWAWGRNSFGQLGDGTLADRLTPVKVSGLTGVVAISGGGYHSLALLSLRICIAREWCCMAALSPERLGVSSQFAHIGALGPVFPEGIAASPQAKKPATAGAGRASWGLPTLPVDPVRALPAFRLEGLDGVTAPKRAAGVELHLPARAPRRSAAPISRAVRRTCRATTKPSRGPWSWPS